MNAAGFMTPPPTPPMFAPGRLNGAIDDQESEYLMDLLAQLEKEFRSLSELVSLLFFYYFVLENLLCSFDRFTLFP